MVLFDSASDVFTLITHNDGAAPLLYVTRSELIITFVHRSRYHFTCVVRRALKEAPENVATLIRVITARLFNLVSDHTFPAPQASPVTSLASSIYRTGTGAGAERNATKEVLNCIRVLQRLLPAVFEIESELSRFEQEVLWKRTKVEQSMSGAGGPAVEEASVQTQFVIEDEDEDDEDEEEGDSSRAPKTPKQTGSQRAQEKPKETLPSIAERLFSCLIDLMFCCGFTLSTKIQVDHYKINYVIWCVRAEYCVNEWSC